MVRGLNLFRERFAKFQDSYVLIGGVACELALDEVGLNFRATKDLDIILCVEALESGFIEQLWRFIEEGGYENRERSDGRKQFYRFSHPSDPSFPHMLELFSRAPDGIELPTAAQYTPIPSGEEVASLSAMLLDEDYYQCIRVGKKIVEELHILTPEYIIPFKARAWLDLTQRKKAGDHVDGRNIRKHRNDIFKLFPLLTPSLSIGVPESVQADIKAFVQAMEIEEGLKIESLGIRTRSLEEVLAILAGLYTVNVGDDLSN